MKILFSDIDGTCVHYPDPEAPFTVFLDESSDGGNATWVAEFTDASPSASPSPPRSAILKLPPTFSGAQGVISIRTLQQYAALRALGIKLVLISGCRQSTLLERLPFIPAADAYVCESGGRIFYPDPSLPTAMGLREDMGWRRLHDAAGPVGQEAVLPSLRQGELWQLYAAASEAGLPVDARNYTTAIRVRMSQEQWDSKFEGQASPLPPGLAQATNLNAIDIYPATSGKKNAAFYLINRFAADPSGADSVFCCDDDNDIELALAVSRAYLPSITSESLRRTVACSPAQFVVAANKSVMGSEEILDKLLELAIKGR